MISFTDSVEGITPERLDGFFVGWPNPPSRETHLELLTHSDHVVLAVDDKTRSVVGFVTAISDQVLAASIPLLEVLPAYQGQGIGTELMRRILEKLSGLYAINLMCDPDLQRFYERLGMKPSRGMTVRNYERQSGSS